MRLHHAPQATTLAVMGKRNGAMSAGNPPEAVAQSVVVPEDFANRIAARFRLKPGETPRLVFHAGPGDAAGSFDHWLAGRHDPRIPIMAYSTQFYALVDQLGAEAHVITERHDPPQGHHPRIRFTPIPRDRTRHGLGWHAAQNRYAWQVVWHIRKLKPHAVVMGIDLPAWAFAALPRKTALILTIHNTFWPMGHGRGGIKTRIRQGLAGLGLRRFTAAICTSPECARQLSILTGRQSGLFVQMPQIPHEHLPKRRQPLHLRQLLNRWRLRADTDVQNNLFVEMPQIPLAHLPAHHQPMEARNLLFLGRIEADKGVFDLLEAFSNLAARHDDINLTIAGTGTALDALREAAAASPYAARIDIPGRLDADGVAQALQNADLLVCPTRSEFNEGLALVIVESAAAGVPSVASSVVPAHEHVPDGCAVYPADDTQALEDTLARLIEDPDAFGALVAGTAPIRTQVLDRNASWGSQLARALLYPERG
ncbi:MAG: Glycosyltransferase [Rhodobacteraceae bacterium HLUCCA12]|nr:MAG: Glycosyltransferase [Rhodobacteraceae bacterium HLUCCA12]